MQPYSALYTPSLISQQLQFLQLLSPFNQYQQILLPLLQNNQPQYLSKEEEYFSNAQLQQLMQQALSRSSQMAQQTYQSPLSLFGIDNQITDSTQENSPKPTFYTSGLGINDNFSLQDKPLEKSGIAYNLEKSAFNPIFPKDKSIDNSSISIPICKKIKKQPRSNSAKKMKKGNASADVSCSVYPQSSLQSQKDPLCDDKNIIHINFTKNLLKSFRRYCEYYHKTNQGLLNQIKRDFEGNHMNNQLLVHFMTSPATMEYFQLFVDGPAQKWVKEQSRLKKQDQQLELIEICRSRMFEKIKVKKYSTDSSFADDSVALSNAPTVASVQQQNLTAQPIFCAIENQVSAVKSAFASSQKEAFRARKSYQTSKNKHRSIQEQNEGEENSFSSSQSSSSSPSAPSFLSSKLGIFEAKIEEVEPVKIEDC